MNRTLKRGMAVVAGVVALGAIGYGGAIAYDFHHTYPQPAPVADAGSTAQIARGQYVAYAADCAACHTAQGGQPFAGGYALGTPFGAILSSNITQDRDSGIGAWDFAQFDRAVRHGLGRHGYLYPAMPYSAYSRMTDADVADLWAYMRTIAPVNQKVVENQLPFPFNQRWLLGGWNRLYAHVPDGPDADAGGGGAELRRGDYLVNGPGHCAACHTAKGAFGGDSAAFLQGGLLGDWYAPNLTADGHTGLGKWTVADIAQYLKTGANDHAVAAGPMTEAVENSTQHLTDADLNAIGVYLKSLAPAAPAQDKPAAADAAVLSTGKLVYESQCIACHATDGSGVRRMIPAFAGSAIVNAPQSATLVRAVLLGMDGPQTAANPTGAGMPRFDWRLPDEDVAAVLTYMRSSWGNQAAAVSASQVHDARTKLQAQAWLGAAK